MTRDAARFLRFLAMLPLAFCILGAGPASRASAGEPDAEAIAKKLDGLLPDLSSKDGGAVERGDRALESFSLNAGRPGAEAERAAVSRALAARLGPDVPVGARVLLLRQIEAIGRWEAVPALAVLLGDEREPLLREGARRALQANPAPQAVRALRLAYEGAKGPFRTALIGSLGARKDSLAVGPLLEDARSEDRPVRLAALAALAEIGDRSAVAVFEELVAKGGVDSDPVRRAYLRLAETMGEGDEGGAARRIYIQALGFGDAFRPAALVGLGRAGLGADAPALLDALGDPDPRIRGAARQGLTTLRGAVKAIAARLEGAPPAVRKDLAAVLGGRKEPAAAKSLAALARDPEKDVRLAAIEALGRAGGEEAVAPLVAALAGDERAAAEGSLAAVSGPGAAAALERAADGATPAVRATLVRVLAARGGPEASRALGKALADPDGAVRAEAYRALARKPDPRAASLLIAALGKESGAGLTDAAGALAAYRDPATAKAALQAIRPRAGDPAFLAAISPVLQSLARRKDAEAVAILETAAKSTDPALRAAGIRALGLAENPETLQFLLDLARSEEGAAREPALDGVVRVARARAGEGAEGKTAAMKALGEVLDLASTPGDRSRALAALGDVGDAGGLPAVRRHLVSGPVRRDAGKAAFRIADRLPAENKDEAVAVLREVLEADPEPPTVVACLRTLRRLGVEMEWAVSRGMVGTFWVLGPIPDPKGDLLKTALPPESKVDPREPLRLGEATFAWKRYAADDPAGAIDLAQATGGGDHVGAYLYAEVVLEKATPGLLKVGSDDAVACFLNGEKVHEHAGDRGLTIDEDSVKVGFKRGVNRLLLKVVNSGGGWGVALRLTDDAGAGLAFVPSSPGLERRVGAQLYIWTQHWGSKGSRVEDHLDETFEATRRAGFHAVQGWLNWHDSPEASAKLGAALAKHGLSMPAAYTGGAMHTDEGAKGAVETILRQARNGRAHGLQLVVMNPDGVGREKTDEELAVQARNLDRLGGELRALGLRLAIHTHDPEMRSGAREWYHILRNTDPEKVGFCLDLHWVYRGKQDPFRLLRDAGDRVLDLHLRNSTGGVWSEDLGDGDIDYRKVAELLASEGYAGFLTLELAYEGGTKAARGLEEDLGRSRTYLRTVFGR